MCHHRNFNDTRLELIVMIRDWNLINKLKFNGNDTRLEFKYPKLDKSKKKKKRKRKSFLIRTSNLEDQGIFFPFFHLVKKKKSGWITALVVIFIG